MTGKNQAKHKMSEIDEGISKIFDIKKRLGKGAYGIVWKALDKRTNETIAVKKIFDAFRDGTDAQRTFREIIFLKAFRNHPNIVKLHNIYKAANNLDIYLIFEYMESDLHNIIKRGTILKDIHKRYVMYQLINAIKYIHSGNVIHRDLKPSNILIDSKCRCKLADFGLARSVANHSSGGASNKDIASDKPSEVLLTDYVATRWYRAPEILVASKRYTKGIDMWSLGCILAEMIRGKPLFQGSSTVDQIEKIVYTLPDITERDIRAVGAGFGSELLNKKVLRERKTTLNDLLYGAPGDALDLVKSLIVLNPMGRLTAHQALNHLYVEKFRNSLPELELNIDILPPFRDDIRLTVPEYRSKLYEIVQAHGEKHKSLDDSKNSINISKAREHKALQAFREKTEQKKKSKVKQYTYSTMDDHYETSNTNFTNTVPRPLTKTIPFAKNKNTKSLCHTIGDGLKNVHKNNEKSEEQFQRNRSREYRNAHLQAHAIGDHLCDNEAIVRRFSTNEVEFLKASTNMDTFKKRGNSSKRLHRSAIALNKIDNESNNKLDYLTQHTPPPTVKNFIRHTKSEVIPFNNMHSSEFMKVNERLCYERRLKKLEEEIELYKREVKNFCRETFSNRPQKQQQSPNLKAASTKTVHNRNTPKKLDVNVNTSMKSINFNLLTKSQHKSYYKSDLDISGNSGNGSSSSDQFRNVNSSSSRRKISKSNHFNPKTNSYQNSQDRQLAEQYHHLTQKHQSQQRFYPISKFF